MNIDNMLYEDMLWLVRKAENNVPDFVKVASKIDLRQEDWSEFWGFLNNFNKQ